MRVLLGCGLVIGLLATAAGADDKKDSPVDAKKLVGKWEAKDLPGDVSLTVEFTKDGKVTAAVNAGGKSEKKEGTYKLVGDKLTVSVKDEKDHTATITKLTDEVLEIKGDGDAKLVILKRAKAK